MRARRSKIARRTPPGLKPADFQILVRGAEAPRFHPKNLSVEARSSQSVSHLRRLGWRRLRYPALPGWANVCRAYGARFGSSVERKCVVSMVLAFATASIPSPAGLG